MLALISYSRDAGDLAAALAYAEQLARLFLTQLGGGDPARTEGLTREQLALACSTRETKLPAGVLMPET